MTTGVFQLPLPVRQVFETFRTCEFTTISKDGAPNTWPLAPLFLPEEGRFLLTT